MTRLHGPAIRGSLRSRESRRGLLQLGDSLIMYKGSRRRLSIARGDMRFGLRFGPHCVCCAVRWANRVRKRVRNAVVEISQNGVYFRRVAPLAQRLEQRPFKSWVVGSNPTGGTTNPRNRNGSKDFLFRPAWLLEWCPMSCTTILVAKMPVTTVPPSSPAMTIRARAVTIPSASSLSPPTTSRATTAAC